MDALIIKATDDSPEVNFDPTTNILSISGESRPENAGKFYAPVIDWLVNFEGLLYWRKHEMKDNSSNVVVKFRLEYFNSTSAKNILDVLLILKRYIDQGYKVSVEWHYDKFSEDILDTGNEFSKMTGVDFTFVEA
ncbi:MAG: DUF1987 domain-containing protein [Bacteroidia bacterium]|jgi:hypothetical protein